MEEQGFVGCLETSPVHKRFKLGSPSREIPVTAQQITKSACCGVPSTYHHYGPTGGSKNEKSFKDQEAGLSVKLAVCKKAGKDKAETAHCKVDQFRFTDDVEIFLPSSKYSVSSSNKQANKPNYLDNEGSSRVQDLQSDSDADLGLLPAIQPQDGITSLSGKVCSLGSVTNREGQVDVKVTNSCHLKNDSNQDTTSRGDCKPCLLDYKDSDQETTSRGDCKSSCLLDYCDTHLPIAQQDLPFEDASAAESIMKKQCNFPSAQVVKLKDLITDQCREELSHLDSCREPSLPTLITVLCDVHVEKSQVSDARDLITQIKKQSTSDRCAAQIDSKHVLEQKEPVFTDVINCQGNLTTALCDNAKDLSKSVVDFTDKENGAPVDDDKPVFYMYSDRYLELCDAMVRVPGRACMVHRLIESYGLLRYVRLVPPCKLRREDLLQFHSEDYLGVLERLNSQGEDGYDEQSQLCGIGYDCPVLPGVLDCASLVAAATVTAANCLVHGKCSVAINWFGGWHHAKKDEASGFCYINDIVLGILRLREKYQRVLYIDLDLHHGDGVEDAFAATSNVFTLSFHKYSSGFFPGTGPMSEVGVGKGRYFSLNVPLLDGIRDDHFHGIVSRLTEKVREVYSPQAVVCQCGADGLAGDPMDSFNLSHLGLGRVIHSLLQWKIPLLLLGGGGYNHANTARAWTFLTSVAVRKKLPPDIPDHRFFTAYGPSYELAVTTGNRKDLNTRDYLTRVFRQALGILQKTSQMLKRTEDVKS